MLFIYICWIYLGLFFYFSALIGIWASLVFYNSYLPDIAHPDQQDRASARGFSMGYIGSVLLLLVNLAMVTKPHAFGIIDDGREEEEERGLADKHRHEAEPDVNELNVAQLGQDLDEPEEAEPHADDDRMEVREQQREHTQLGIMRR